MKLLIATDAWRPQINGVVHTLERVGAELGRKGVEVIMLTPNEFRTVPLPGYPEIPLAVATPGVIGSRAAQTEPDAVHIATEGPVGFAVRRWCLRNHRPFTTSFHTRFPEYIAARWPIPLRLSYSVLRRFHNSGRGCMVATASMQAELESRGFRNLFRWSRGVDADFFRPMPELRDDDVPRPVSLYVGRVAVEKNIRAFLELDLPGTKRVVGDGPALAELRRDFPNVRFSGMLTGPALAAAYANADVFVFPSRTDTYGIVLLQALSSGLPVAAFPVPGPIDVIGEADVGVLSEDLRSAVLRAVNIPGRRCRQFAKRYSWEACAVQFLDNVLVAQGVEIDASALAGEVAG